MNTKIHLLFALAILTVGYHVIDLNHQISKSTVPEIVDARSYFKEKKIRKQAGMAKMDSPEKYGEIQRQLRTPIDEQFPQYSDNYLVKELSKAKKNITSNGSRNELDFISRGPGNIAGRTRALLVDPRDESHTSWIAGSASGGIWKTSNAGKNWRNVSGDLTSLSTNTLAMSLSNPDIIYAGTGEHFVNDTDGNGLWKSEDNGESWAQIANPEQYDGFKNISRIIVDPENSDIVLLATSNGSWVEESDYAIWKSEDGGLTFVRKYTSELGRVDDLDFNPLDFNIMYAAVEQYGIIKSTDGGESWFEPGFGFNNVGRVEISVSSADTSVVWASADGGSSDAGSTVYRSSDGAKTWSFLDNGDVNINYLGGQGFYDNIITAHPYEADIAYIGGVNLFKVTTIGQVENFTDFSVDESNTRSFLDFINGTRFQDESRIPIEEMKSVSIRFGSGSQNAHRFTAGGLGAGVSFGIYDYNDYVEVPFTVWDEENDVQLMVSFRDQNMNGGWDLIEENTSVEPFSSQSREYIFVHDIPYNESASELIAVEGGVEERLMYFIWPILADGSAFGTDDLPDSRLYINKITAGKIESSTEFISDAYGQFNGINTFSDENFINQKGVHPDQHNIIIVKEDEGKKTFRFIATNDGGVYITKVGIDPGTNDGGFNYGGFGYNTSQFYGADKAPGENRYIGGMQDNSTFFTPPGVEADSAARYDYAIGGDGFESIWNNSNPYQLIGGSQFNNFARSLDGGKTWIRATDSITEGGPFISRLANSKRFPNRLFTVGPSGVWKSENFGGAWESSPIDEMWSFNNSVDIEVSHADSSVIWAGGFLDEDQRVFVSQDNGLSFSPVNNYQGEELGFVSGIGTHASDNATAYLLFSFSGKPKVIRTTDFGQTWEDISGFEGNSGVSDRGFPNVAIQSLLVFPNNNERIWVGSEIGIIESLNGGDSWSLLDCNMPPVNVHDFKIQDDQIVIATYGRGIWSVQVEGIEQNFLLDPSVITASQDIKGDLDIKFYLPSKYDSTFIYIDGARYDMLGENEKGEFNSLLGNLEIEGEVAIEIESYANGVKVLSLPYILHLYIPSPVVTQYDNDFSNADRLNEFAGAGFRVILEDGFQDEAIHSDHPHTNGIDITYQLTSPYLLTEESPNHLGIREVAIIEPGEPETVFGDSEFWDYVVIEGSKNGTDWISVAPGYDSRDYPEWLDTFNVDGNVTSSLYKERRIDLSETFAVGDTIIIRFRLNADAFVNGWGWAIDDVEIGEVSSGLVDLPLTNNIRIYPNPVKDRLVIGSDVELRNTEVRVFDLSGKEILKLQDSQEVNLSGLISGTYFISIIGDEVNEIHKFIKI